MRSIKKETVKNYNLDRLKQMPYDSLSIVAGWSSLVARRAHNPKVVGSNPAPATNIKSKA